MKTLKKDNQHRKRSASYRLKREIKGEGGQADRREGGAIIAGFMYELLIESVVTS